MALQPNSSFGNYHIGNVIGEGGMGQVYLATDTTLDRKVAIKVLPDSFAQDSDRVARFEREAKTLASLNHNNIAQIYGIEKGVRVTDSDTSAPITAIVMELVEGPTLAERLEQGPLAPEEALRIARQIIDGLEAAHAKGIVHRDLKPANIKVTADGLVKILDFGIAKSVDSSSSNSGRHTPTMVTPAVTESGVIMGTAAYMSPEQARGKFVDQRTDIWAFGCLLYEMLTGQPAFGGQDVAETMARIITLDADTGSLTGVINPAVNKTIKLCLQKDVKKRIADIRDVRLSLQGGFTPEAALNAEAGAPVAAPLWRRMLPVVASVGMAALVGLLAWHLEPEVPRPVVRFVHDLPDGRALVLTSPGILDIATDGRRLVYKSTDGLVVRDLDAVEDRVIPGTQPAFAVEFSPDGESLAYFRLGGGRVDLVRMAITGGAEVQLANFPTTGGGSISWEPDGTLLVGWNGVGIFRVSESGGEPELIVALEPDQTQGGPQLLPGGEWLLASLSQGATADVVVQSLVTGERKLLRPGASHGRFVPTGHLVYMMGGTLFAVAFDPASADLSATPVPVVQDMRSTAGASISPYAFADDGTLVYVQGAGRDSTALTLALGDGQGNEVALAVPAGAYANPRASADGRWVAYEVRYSDGTDIAVWELGSAEAPRRLTFGGDNTRPTWSADSMRVAYSSARADGPGVYWRLGDGSGTEERLTQAAAGETQVADHFSPDGQYLAYTVGAGGTSTIWLRDLASGDTARLIESPGAGASHAVFAPDGRWLAYQAHDTGDNEIFVQPFPLTGAKYQLPSRADNHHPAWSADERQLYYIPAPDRLERVSVATERGVGFGTPVSLTVVPLQGAAPLASRSFDIMPDGSILGVMAEGAESELKRDRLFVVQNWFEELKRLVPTE